MLPRRRTLTYLPKGVYGMRVGTRGLASTLAAGLVVVVVIGSWASPQAQGVSSCVAAGSRTVASSSQVRVYLGDDDAYKVCNRRTNRRYRIDPESQIAAVRIAGGYVAFEQSVSSSSGSVVSVRVLNTRKGRYQHVVPQRFSLRSATPPVPGDVSERVTDLVLPSSGRAAWIAEVRSYVPCEGDPLRGCGPRVSHEVRQAVSRSRFRVLDSSPTLLPRSLALSGSRVRWVRDGRRVERRIR